MYDMIRGVEHRNLKSAMAKNGMRQKNLAEIIGVNHSTANQKINGKVLFNLVEVVILLKYFNSTFEDLFFNIEFFEKLKLKGGEEENDTNNLRL